MRLLKSSIACLCGLALLSAAALPCNAKKRIHKMPSNVSTTRESINKDEPDFAFPQTVIDKAEAQLRKAAETGDETAVIRSAIQLVVANNSISTDRMPAMAQLLDSLAQRGSVPGAAILYSLEAQLYQQVYSSARYTFDQRNLPLDTYPKDPQQWSRGLFAKKVMELVNKSLAHTEQLAATPSTAWKSLLDNSEEHNLEFYPTLYSILANNNRELLLTFRGESTIPFGSESQLQGPELQCSECAASIAREWLKVANASGNVAEISVALPATLQKLPAPARFKEYLDYYEKYKLSPYSAEFLDNAYNTAGNISSYLSHMKETGDVTTDTDPDKEEEAAMQLLATKMEECISAHPGYFRINALKNDLREIKHGQGSVSTDQTISTRQELQVKAKTERLPANTHICLYKLTVDAQSYYGVKKLLQQGKAKLVKTMPLPQGEARQDTCMLNFGNLGVGNYVIAVSQDASGAISKLYNDYCQVKVTDISFADFQVNNEIYLLVTNSFDSKPYENARVTFMDKSTKQTKTGTTDTMGMTAFPAWFKNNSIKCTVRIGDDVATLERWMHSEDNATVSETEAAILTDLALYHPGDTCRFSVVLYKKDGYRQTPLENKRFRVVLMNTSYVPCDTLELTTGAHGRAEGSLKLPKDGMNGTAFIYVQKIDSTDKYDSIAGTTIQVEDYKQPTFFVELDPIANIVPGDTLRINGTVRTYSGMPMSGAQVKITIGAKYKWWWMPDDRSGTYSADAVTGADGRFSIALATDRLKGTGYANRSFNARATVTSEAGETQQSESEVFACGNRVTLTNMSASLFDGDVACLPFRYEVDGGTEDNKSLNYCITDAIGNIITEGDSESPCFDVKSELLPSGEYTIMAKVRNAECTSKFTVYRLSDKVPAQQSALWVPKTSYTTPAGTTSVDIKAGSADDNYIYYIVYDKSGILGKGVLHPEGKMDSVHVKAPVGRYSRTRVAFFTTDSCNFINRRVDIIPEEARQNVKVEKISFRDKINAGGKERWTFRYTFADKNLANIPVIGTMTDKSLNAIYPFTWNAISEVSVYNNGRISGSINNYPSSLSFSYYYSKHLQVPGIFAPGINAYNGLYSPVSNLRIRGARYKSMALMDAAAPAPEAAELNEDAVETYTVTNAFAGDVKESRTYAAVKEDAEEETADAGGAAEQPQQKQYRPAEMPLAWFKPNLCTDGDGVLELSFTAPDFNTTWQLQMLGYNEDMLSNLLVEDIVASKPVMVTVNSPRFLRTGDRVTLMATVFNNSDKTAPLSARMEIYDPLTEKSILVRDFAVEDVAVSGSRVVDVEFTAPSDLEFVAYRVLGKSGDFSDGEQSLIAIVPSSSPVTESWPFYMAPTRNDFSMQLPRLNANAQVSFQYCDNPVWECVTALPDMTVNQNANILSHADRMYGNAIAAGLVRQFPQLGNAIKLWSESGDSTLVSKLQRDSELKVVALGRTPWVNNAETETLRMSQLTNLLDADKCKKAIDESMKKLIDEQKGGGWSWCKGMEPSMFITGQVLWRLGMLSQMGYLPEGESVQRMIVSALHFCEKELYKDYIEAEKHFSTSTMLNYLYIRSFFPSVDMSADFSSLKKKALQAIRKEWKEFGIYNKATAATLMSRQKEPMLARTILESLNQFASKSEERGMWFDNLRSGFFTENTLITTAQALEAFNEITPKAPAVDLLRQWLIIERQAQDWGKDAQLAEVVYAILSSGSNWTVASEPARFFLGDKELTPAHRDRLTGSFTMPLTAEEASGATLRVLKNGEHQAWGGVLARYISPIDEVKEFSESDVTVNKRILVVEETKDGTSVRPIAKGEKLKLGQKIRVQLTVTSDRDIDYAVITDERGGCMAPADQLSHYVWQDGTGFYREVRNEATDFFLPRLPKGDFILEYDGFASQEGTFAVGIASLQSLYAPTLSAHSAGATISITK